MSEPTPPGKLLAGHVGKPHGIKGEVYVHWVTDDPRRWQPGSVLWLGDSQVTVESSRRHGDRFLVKFAQASSRQEAEQLRGMLFVDPDDARALETGEFWHHDLLGCAVILPEGTPVGTVTGVHEGPAQDLLEVETPEGTRLIPLVKGIVVKVEIARRRISIDPPEGLL